MKRAILLLLAVVAGPGTGFSAPSPVDARDPMPAVRADRWDEAAAIADAYPDRLAAKLVTYYRLLAPGMAELPEIDAFMTANPDWPAQGLLERRRQEALARMTDDAAVVAECDRAAPSQPLTWQRCADAYAAAGRADAAAASRQAAEAATRRAGTPPMLEQARGLRLAGQDSEALALWRAEGAAAQREAPDGMRARFWSERHALARQLLRDGDAQGAYDLINGHGASGHGQAAAEQTTDAEFLAGFIALRRLNDPNAAARHFKALADASRAVITQGRAQYWLGRAEAAAGRDPRQFYQQAAAWPTSFYGQMAAVSLGETPASIARRIGALRDPAWTAEQVRDLSGRELARAAALLAAWNEPRRAHAFLLRLDELAPDAADRALNARLALSLGMPEMAVFIARRMGRDGLPLPDAGWPIPVDPPRAAAVDPAIALGIMRQESSFETAVISPAGARGLMQLMPGTAQLVARQLGETTSAADLTRDPAHNMRLGTTYLRSMLDRFSGELPLAAAAYNAGPNRVEAWLAANDDPRTGKIDMIDWIELIPFNETRNYVQRVLENVVIYRAKRGEIAPTIEAQWGR